MAHELAVAKLYEPGSVLHSFKKFRDPLQRIDLPQLCDWIEGRTKISAATMAKRAT